MGAKTKARTLLYCGYVGSCAGGLYEVEALRTGHWDYPDVEGGLDITPELLADLVLNFNQGAKGFEVPLDGPSRGGEAHADSDLHDCGWVKSLEIAPDGQSLKAIFEITNPEVRAMVDEGSLRYCSSELDLAWFDPEDKTTKKVFEGLSLTNRPYLKRMQPISPCVNLSEFVAARDPGDAGTTKTGGPMAENNNGGVALAELQTQLAAEKDARAKLEAEISSEKAARERLETETRQANVRARMAEVKVRLDALARKGKITVPIHSRIALLAQTLLGEGKSVIGLGTKVKLGKRSKLDDGTETVEETDKLDVIDEMLDMLQDLPSSIATDSADLEEDERKDDEDDDDEKVDAKAKAKMKENSKLSYKQAYSMVLREMKEKRDGR